MDYTTILNCVMSSITTIAVAFLGYFQSKKAKENEEYKKLREQLEEERNKKAQEKEEKEEKRLRELEQIVSSLNKDVKNLNDCVDKLSNSQTKDIKDINEQLEHLHTIQTDNFSYMQSLSNVVTTIGESLHDSGTVDANSKDKITQSIENHRKTEQEIHKKLYNIIV